MEVLKKILAVMVGILVVIVIAGGYYYLSMRSMGHNKSGAQMQQSMQQDQKTELQDGKKAKQQDQTNKETDKTDRSQNSSTSTTKKTSENDGTQQPPQIVEVVPPKPKKDPQQYINEIQDSINTIDRENTKILNNISGSVNIQTKDSNTIISSGQDNMNQVHSSAYKMGQEVAILQGVLNDMKDEVRSAGGTQDNFFQRPPQAFQYYQVPYPPYGYNPYYNFYSPINPNNQYPDNWQNSQQNPQNNPQNNPNQNMPANHNMSSGLNIGNLFSGQSLQLIFALILIVSLFLGVVALFGFFSSLFKGKNA